MSLFQRIRGKLISAIGVSLVAGSLLGATSAFAEDPIGRSGDKAVPLSGKLTGTLPADSGGSFAYYQFYYPAKGPAATVNLQILPDDPAILQNAGMVIYGPQAGREYFRGGQQPKLYPNVSGNIISSDSNDSGTYVVQVFSYNAGTPLTFEIWLEGVPTPVPANAVAGIPPVGATPVPGVAAPSFVPPVGVAPPVAPVVAATATPTGPANVQPGQTIFQGSLPAKNGGSFALYEFNYTGNDAIFSINVNIKPDDAAVIKPDVAGFKVYGPQAGKIYVNGGFQKDLNPNLQANIINREPGLYVIQLYNYHPSVSLTFDISMSTQRSDADRAANP